MKKILCLCLCFLMVISLAVPAFAASADISTLPSPYTVWTSEFQQRFPYAVVYQHGSFATDPIYLYVSSTEIYVANDRLQNTEGDEGLTYLRWTFDRESGSWSNYTGFSNTLFMPYQGTNYPILASSFDLKYSNGTLISSSNSDFFPSPPSPLWEEIAQVTQGEIPILTQGTAMTASTLVACGIGCLALLMGLVLLAKKFRRFLP